MNALDWSGFFELRRHLDIVHHVPGRIRLRLGEALWEGMPERAAMDLEQTAMALPGIQGVRLNPAAASLIIHYDRRRLAPELWETLVWGSDEEVMEGLIGLLAAREWALEK